MHLDCVAYVNHSCAMRCDCFVMISIVVPCIGIKLLMISIIVPCIEIKLLTVSIVVPCIGIKLLILSNALVLNG